LIRFRSARREIMIRFDCFWAPLSEILAHPQSLADRRDVENERQGHF